MIDENFCNEVINQQDVAMKKTPRFFFSDRIGNTNIWIGSRRAGRPPECWSSTGYDCILNVTVQEYAGIVNDSKKRDVDRCHVNSKNINSDGSGCNRTHFYLQLPVKEGKRDKTQ